jgi:hypothetical protein
MAESPGVRRSVLLAIALAALGCASSPGVDARARKPTRSRTSRCARASSGSPSGRASRPRARSSEAIPVQRPGHPEDPYPSPRRSLSLEAGGEALRLELYVVAARSAEGCPDVHVEDAPVAFRSGTVAALGWEEVEANWRAWVDRSMSCATCGTPISASTRPAADEP